jgi:hypothetical protein
MLKKYGPVPVITKNIPFFEDSLALPARPFGGKAQRWEAKKNEEKWPFEYAAEQRS